MKKIAFCIFAIALIFTFSFQTAIAKERELKAVTFLPTNHPYVTMVKEWVKRVNDACSGELKVKLLGGPEVVPGLEQIEALKKGVVQVTFNVTAYYQARMPEGGAFALSKLTPWAQREPGGLYDFFVKAHKKKVNAMYLGQWIYGTFYLWVKDPVKTPDDLRGVKLRTTALYDRFMKALGAVPVTINIPEVYTALKRGTVDGAGWPVIGARQFGWTEEVKYVIDHPFFGMNSTILMNLDVWNSLSPAVQSKIKEVTIMFEPYMAQHLDNLRKAEWMELEKVGVKKIHFSPADAKRFVDTAYEVEWGALEKKVPDLVPTLKKLSGN